MDSTSSSDLRRMAAQHEELARKLREAAELMDSLSSSAHLHVERRSKQSQRERELITYLKDKGPSTVHDIALETPIKLSTVYALCQPRDGKQSLFFLDKKTSKVSLKEDEIRKLENRG